MAGTPLADPIARAFAGVGAFAGPITYTADMMHEGELLHPVFRVGAAPVASMMGMRPVTYDRLSVGYWLRQDAHYQQLLRHALESGAQAGESLLEGWAERIQPPPQELLDLAQVLLPDMLATDLLSMPFSPTYEPPKTAYLPRMPAQLPFVAPSCVRNAMELLTEDARKRVHTWLARILDQLRCIELLQPDCELLRPQPLVLGQDAMLPWAQGRIWDLTFERAQCAVPLDMTLPIETHLNLEFLERRLATYPDQNMLSHLLEGVRFEADVELGCTSPSSSSSPPDWAPSPSRPTYATRSGYGSKAMRWRPPLCFQDTARTARCSSSPTTGCCKMTSTLPWRATPRSST